MRLPLPAEPVHQPGRSEGLFARRLFRSAERASYLDEVGEHLFHHGLGHAGARSQVHCTSDQDHEPERRVMHPQSGENSIMRPLKSGPIVALCADQAANRAMTKKVGRKIVPVPSGVPKVAGNRVLTHRLIPFKAIEGTSVVAKLSRGKEGEYMTRFRQLKQSFVLRDSEIHNSLNSPDFPSSCKFRLCVLLRPRHGRARSGTALGRLVWLNFPKKLEMNRAAAASQP